MENLFKGRASCNFLCKENLSETILNKDSLKKNFFFDYFSRKLLSIFCITEHLTFSFPDAAGICSLITSFVKAILEHTFCT